MLLLPPHLLLVFRNNLYILFFHLVQIRFLKICSRLIPWRGLENLFHLGSGKYPSMSSIDLITKSFNAKLRHRVFVAEPVFIPSVEIFSLVISPACMEFQFGTLQM